MGGGEYMYRTIANVFCIDCGWEIINLATESLVAPALKETGGG
jgi:hypothetical protein